MDQIELLEYSLAELRNQVVALDDSDLDVISNCDPWTVRQLASHALNNQLLWAGIVTGQALVSPDSTMSGVAIDGKLAPVAHDVYDRTLALWRTAGVLDAIHATPMGELPGSVVINFATIDALCHAWDIGTSVGRPMEFATERIPAITGVVEATCTDAARDHGLIKPAPPTRADATDTERLMAQAGRASG